MAEVPPAKRQRTDTIGAAATIPATVPLAATPFDWMLIINKLPQQTRLDILIAAAERHQDVGLNLANAHIQILRVERDKVIDFDHYSKTAWKALNVTYARLSMSKQYEISHEACHTIQDCIAAIGDQTPAHASYGTKKSALETLRKIGKTIALGPMDEIGKAVKQNFQYETCLEETMVRVVESMSETERADVMTMEFEDKLEELEELAGNQCIFEDLKRVRETLLAAVDEEEEEEEEEEEGADGEEDGNEREEDGNEREDDDNGKEDE
jgi:hypothetical protein